MRYVFAFVMKARAASATPVLGMQLLMGEQAVLMPKNVMAAIASSALESVELVASAD